MSYTEVTKPTTFPNTKWDEPANFWDEEDLNWDGSGYADIDKVFNYNWFIASYYPFLDTGYPFQRYSYVEITKPT